MKTKKSHNGGSFCCERAGLSLWMLVFGPGDTKNYTFLLFDAEVVLHNTMTRVLRWRKDRTAFNSGIGST